MNIDNKNLRSEELETLSSQQLDQLLHRELEKDVPNAEVVIPILHILEERDSSELANKVDTETVWKAYQDSLKKDAPISENSTRKKRKTYRWIGRVAAIAAIVGILITAVPKAMGAENIFEILGRWTQTIFEFFNPTDSTEPLEEYVFKTDHPGLQQIYDAVTEQGVTRPVVPRWVPEGFVLDELKTMPVRGGKKLYAVLKDDIRFITIAIEIYNENRSNQYTKDDTSVGKYELDGVTHYTMVNEENLQVVWVVENLECVIRSNCQEEILYRVLTSIYVEVD